MKLGFLLLSMLILSNALSAQGDGASPLCFDLIDGTDSECTFPFDCSNRTGCTAVEFTAACTGTYSFDVWTECAGCKHCWACSFVYRSGQQVGNNCHATRCDLGDCFYTCTVDLIAGNGYVLYICLGACPIEHDCSECGAGCTAHACLRYGQITTCY